MAGDNKQREDEVGWLFVQEYYTMMNKTPQKLHLFYKKGSTFVHGVEGESNKVSQGQREILTKVQELNFKDCKVLVSNVDSQASFDNTILIQVLGEMSNNGQDSRKFAQTFLLAPQETGYYVHNDIFRFLKEELSESDFGGEETNAHEETLFSHGVNTQQQSGQQQQQQQQVSHAALTNGTGIATPVEPELSAATTKDSKSAPAAGNEEKVPSPTQTPVVPSESTPRPEAERSVAVETLAAPPTSSGSATTDAATSSSKDVAASAAKSSEEPVAAAPAATTIPGSATGSTPATGKASSTEPAEPVKPAAPLSWAARAAANAAKTATAAVVNKVAPVVAPTAMAPAASAKKQNEAPAAQNQASTSAATASGNQTGSGEASKSAFLKSITPGMSEETIRRELAKHGPFKTVDINRTKKCGFVDFLSAAACASAIKQNLFEVDGETLLVEERRKDVHPGKGGYGGKKFDKSGGTGGRGGGSGTGASAQRGQAGRNQGAARTSTPVAK